MIALLRAQAKPSGADGMRRGLVVTFTVVGLAMVFASGRATAGAYECQGWHGITYNLCMYHDGDFNGTIWVFTQSVDGYNQWNYVGSSANDQVSSLYNYRQHTAWLDMDSPAADYSRACLLPAAQLIYLSDYQWPGPVGLGWMNDTISSYDLLYSATTCPSGTQPYHP